MRCIVQLTSCFSTVLTLLSVATAFTVGATESTGGDNSTFSKVRLSEKYDQVYLIPGERQCLLVSRQEGRIQQFDLELKLATFDIDIDVAVADTVISRDARFAYLLDSGANVGARVWRVDLTSEFPVRSVPLPTPLVRASILALGPGNKLILAGPETNTIALLDVARFDEQEVSVIAPIASESHFEIIELPFGPADIAVAKKDDLVFLSSMSAPEIYGFDLNTRQTDLFTFVPVASEAMVPLALALSKGREGEDGSFVPLATVGDEGGRRIMIFELNRSFRALDFITRADITVDDRGKQPTRETSPTSLVIGASENLSAIVAASHLSRSVYFFSLSNNILQQLDRRDIGPVVDAAVAPNGRLAALLVEGGTSLVLVDRPDLPAPSVRGGARPEIVEVQKQLIARGFLVGAADGILGKSTTQAIKLFQESELLRRTGKLDDETRFKLQKKPERRFFRELADLTEHFQSYGIRHFHPNDFLLTTETDECKNHNHFPPKQFWCYGSEIARVLDVFRERWGSPVRIDSAYRSPEYSNCMGDEVGSPYNEFRAVDFHSTKGTPADWVALMETMQSEGMFNGRVEARSDHAHLEVQSSSELWVFVGSSSDRAGDFQSIFFDIREPPSPGETLMSTQQVSLRASAPFKKDGDWVMGEEVSFLHPGLVLHVDRVIKLDDPSSKIRYWVGGRVSFADNGADSVASENWFVLLSWHRSEEEAVSAMKLLQNTRRDLHVEIYLADENWLVVSFGANLAQGEAKKRLLEIKCAGTSENPFMFPAKGWKKVSEPAP